MWGTMKRSDLTPIMYKNSSTSCAAYAGGTLGTDYARMLPMRSFDTIFNMAINIKYNTVKVTPTYRLFFIVKYNPEFVNMLTREHLISLGFSNADIPGGLD